MKELSIEEKAKAYDKALERVKDFIEKQNPPAFDKDLIGTIYPELAESEDDKVRKELIKHLKELSDWKEDEVIPVKNPSYYRQWASWLENVPVTIDHEKREGFHLGYKACLEKQGEQKPAEWSKLNEEVLDALIRRLEGEDIYVSPHLAVECLKSLKGRVQPKQEWKQENTHDLTDFENVMMHIGDSFFGQYAGLDPNDTIAIKEQANILLGLVPKQEWNKEDKERIKNIISVLDVQVCWDWATGKKGNPYQKEIDWLKSLRPQNHWKPSELQLGCLSDAIKHYNSLGYPAPKLKELLDDLKKLKEGKV